MASRLHAACCPSACVLSSTALQPPAPPRACTAHCHSACILTHTHMWSLQVCFAHARTRRRTHTCTSTLPGTLQTWGPAGPHTSLVQHTAAPLTNAFAVLGAVGPAGGSHEAEVPAQHVRVGQREVVIADGAPFIVVEDLDAALVVLAWVASQPKLQLGRGAARGARRGGLGTAPPQPQPPQQHQQLLPRPRAVVSHGGVALCGETVSGQAGELHRAAMPARPGAVR